MKFSVYDAETQNYYYYSSDESFSVDVNDYYGKIPFVPWQDVKIRLPASRQEIGMGPYPQGVVVHPDELLVPACAPPQRDWIWAAVILVAEWFLIQSQLFGKED